MIYERLIIQNYGLYLSYLFKIGKLDFDSYIELSLEIKNIISKKLIGDNYVTNFIIIDVLESIDWCYIAHVVVSEKTKYYLY